MKSRPKAVSKGQSGDQAPLNTQHRDTQVVEENGELKGTAAVIDKDYASSLLALAIGVDLFLISTAVEQVALNFGQPNQEWLDRMTLTEAKQYLEEGPFAPGSMYPKIQAIVDFLEGGDK